MINASYDSKLNTVFIEFNGKIDANQAEKYYSDIQKIVPRGSDGFKVLTDFSKADGIDFAVRDSIKKVMDFFNASGVTQVFRVIPDPNQDIGLNIMSFFHYSKEVQIFTFTTRSEAEARLRAPAVKPIPAGYHSVTPSLTFKDTAKAMDFYARAFGAKQVDVFPHLDGKGIMHATMEIGNSIVMMGDENPNCPSAETLKGSSVSLFVYVPDSDEVFQKALDAGAVCVMPVMEMFWGDRAGSLKDPFGYSWMIATHTRDMTKEEIKKEAEAFFSRFSKE